MLQCPDAQRARQGEKAISVVARVRVADGSVRFALAVVYPLRLYRVVWISRYHWRRLRLFLQRKVLRVHWWLCFGLGRPAFCFVGDWGDSASKSTCIAEKCATSLFRRKYRCYASLGGRKDPGGTRRHSISFIVFEPFPMGSLWEYLLGVRTDAR